MQTLTRTVILLVACLPAALAAEPPGGEERSVVRGYFVEQVDSDSLLATLRVRYPESPGVKFAFDQRTRQVVVVAPHALQQRIARDIENRLARREPPGDRVVGPAHPEAEDALPLVPNSGREAVLRLPVRTLTSTYSLQDKNLSPRDFEEALRQIYGSRLDVRREPGRTMFRLASVAGYEAFLQLDHQRGEVAFTAPAEAQPAFEKLLKTLDSRQQSPREELRILSFQRSDPDEVRRTVAQLQTGAERKEKPVDDTRTPAEKQAEAAAQVRRRAAAIMAKFLQPAPAAQPPVPRQPVLPPAGQDPDAGPPDDEGVPLGSVRIEFLDGLDVIIVRGKKRDVERVMKIIEEIERLSDETRPTVVVHHLQHTNNEALGQLLVQVYDQILASRQGRVSITPLVKPNALLLIGRPENVDLVLELIQKLDQPVAPSTRIRVFRLKHLAAVDAEQTVRGFFERTGTAAGATTAPAPGPGGAQAPAAPTGPRGAAVGGLGTRVNVIAEFRSNSLLVQASPRDLEEVAALIQQIDIESTAATNEVRIFRLKNSLANEIGPVLQSAIRGQATTGQTGQGQQGAGGIAAQLGQQFGGQTGGGTRQGPTRSTNLQFMTVDPTGKQRKMLSSVIPSDVLITADTPANALIVRGPTKSMDLIAALIKELDQLPAAESQIKVFTIINGDATNVAQTLQTLFGQAVTIGRGSGGAFGNQAAFGQLGQQLGGGPNSGESTLVPLRFAVDVRTNSIISSGSASDLKVVETLLLRLDEGDVPARKMTVYRLKNAFAQDVADSITSFLQSQRQVIQNNQLFNQAVGPFEQLEREMVVVAEPQSNSVIVSATPKFYEDIMRIIKQLDFRPPMVMVQVLIAEVQLTDLYEFGVELGLQDSLLFDRGKAALATGPAPAGSFPQSGDPANAPGFNFNPPASRLPNANSFGQESLAGQALSSFGVGRGSGLVLSAANESISILLRALQDSGKMQVLSRPQVMAIHNRQAQVLVGQKVPRSRGSTQTATAVTQNIEDVDVGLILNIIPQINDDGVIVMNIQAENSKLGGNVTIPSGDGTAVVQTIDTTQAVTTISAKDNQTVVFAGLITTDKEVNVRRIPYLSDIPYLGKLFEFKRDNFQRRELLIVMTPHIIKDDADYDWINGVESERMSWCLGDVVTVHGDVGLRGGNCLFCNPKVPVIYPDFDPTGSEVVLPMPMPAPVPSQRMQPGPAVMPESLPAPLYRQPEMLPPARDMSNRRGDGRPTTPPPLTPLNRTGPEIHPATGPEPQGQQFRVQPATMDPAGMRPSPISPAAYLAPVPNQQFYR